MMNGKRTATVPVVQAVVPAPAVSPVARPGGPAAARDRLLRLPQPTGPTVERSGHDDRGRERLTVWILAAILVIVLLGQAATAILLEVHTPTQEVRYLTTDTYRVEGWPVEWKVRLEIRGEPVVVSVWSEREAVRLEDAFGGRGELD